MSRFYTYIVRCSDNSLYTGYAKDLAERLIKHNQGKAAKYTRTRLPVELVYFEVFDNKNQAMGREARLKQLSRQQKLALIESNGEVSRESLAGIIEQGRLAK